VGKPSRLFAALYRAIIRLQPVSRRRQYGDEQIRVAEELWANDRPAGLVARAAWSFRLLGRALWAALGSHLDVRTVGGLRRPRERHWGGAIQDVRFALRTLMRDRSFAIVAVLILALGIAANTAVFSVVNTVLLRPLPFPDAQRLVWLQSGRELPAEVRGAAGLSAQTYTASAFEEFQRHNRSFANLTAYNPFFGNSEYTLTAQGDAQPIAGVMVACSFFQTLGVQPERGRLFTAEECQKGGRAAVVLSDGFWQRQFGGDVAIVGQAVRLGTQDATVVGVLPSTFDFGSVFSPGLAIDAYVPAVMDEIRNWGNTLAVVGRLKPGVSLSQAQAEADVTFPQLRAAHPDWGMTYLSTITGLKEFVTGKLRRSLVVLWCAVGLILLIICVNLLSLLFARSSVRSREFAVRSALGAGRGRLVRQVVTESLVLSSVGAVSGLGLAEVLTRWIAHQGSIALPLLSRVSVDAAALIWTLLIATATTVVLGVVPGLRIVSVTVQDALKDGNRGTTAGRTHERVRAVLVISEVAFSCLLLVGAGLLLRSFLRVLDVDLGFAPGRATVIKVDYNDGSSPARRGAILREMQRNVDAIPGVEASGVADMLPLGRNRSWMFSAKGTVSLEAGRTVALIRVVTPGYLAAMGIHLREGRDFTWHDTPDSERVVIINQAAARRFWPAVDPVSRLSLVNGDAEARVIGVISDVRETSVEGAVGPEIYLPATQADPEGAELVIGTALPPAVLASSVLRMLRSLNPSQPAAELRPLERIVDHAVSPRRFFATLVLAFAALGLVLASLGIYGVISFTVTQQTQEIGIRMALGATAGQVQGRVMARALRLALSGTALGAMSSLAFTRWIASLLFGTGPTDPVTFGTVVLLLGLVALVAGFMPARRASHIDPVVALRGD
jgi:predicted permease